MNGQRENLFGIAFKTLGDGRRYRELSALNHDRPQPDGRRMTDPLMVEPGWILLLPADARGGSVSTDAPPAPPATPGRAAPAAADTFRWGAALAFAVVLLIAGALLLWRRRPAAAPSGPEWSRDYDPRMARGEKTRWVG